MTKVFASTSRVAVLSGLMLILISGSAVAAKVVVVVPTEGASSLLAEIQLSSKFYGVDVETLVVSSTGQRSQIDAAVRNHETVAVVVAAEALKFLPQPKLLASVRRPVGHSVPVMVSVPEDASVTLSGGSWSLTGIKGCSPLPKDVSKWELAISGDPDFGRELAGVTLPIKASPGCGPVVDRPSRFRSLLTLTNAAGQSVPLLLDDQTNGQHVFLVGEPVSDTGASNTGVDSAKVFAAHAPMLMFLRFAAGDRAWHVSTPYANLTIDDPWLTEPYGNLRYKALLSAMDEHNFHTTIAFIPWNFDRSEADVVSLFRSRPDRFSIGIHGNNHNHREFGDYSREPLNGQIANLKQAITRMEAFKNRTGLSYDPVMVFPHGIAPGETITALGAYNLWGTVNSQNVPLGSAEPADPLFKLRTWNVVFGALAVQRTSAEAPVSPAVLAVNAYLGNPQLFYAHQQAFENGIGAFDPIADQVNRLIPSIRWGSLGQVIQHLYLSKVRDDGDLDVLAFSPSLALENPSDRPMVAHVQKSERQKLGVASLLIDGQPSKFEHTAEVIRFDVPLSPHQHRQVTLTYSSDLTVASIDTSKDSLRVTVDRRLSDVRDLWLSRLAAGQALTRAYYDSHLDTAELAVERWFVPAVLLAVAYVVIHLIYSQALRGRVTPGANHVTIRQPGTPTVKYKGNHR